MLLSPDLSGLTAAHCARVRACGVRVAGLAMDSQERQQLLALGVDDVVEPGDSEQAFLAALGGLAGDEAEELARREPPELLAAAPRGRERRERARRDREQGHAWSERMRCVA